MSDPEFDEAQAEALRRYAEARRKHLHARMAGNIAAGLAHTGVAYGSDELRQAIADGACDLAERILKRIGL